MLQWKSFSAEEALQFGLVDRIVPAPKLEEETMRFVTANLGTKLRTRSAFASCSSATSRNSNAALSWKTSLSRNAFGRRSSDRRSLQIAKKRSALTLRRCRTVSLVNDGRKDNANSARFQTRGFGLFNGKAPFPDIDCLDACNAHGRSRDPGTTGANKSHHSSRKRYPRAYHPIPGQERGFRADLSAAPNILPR